MQRSAPQQAQQVTPRQAQQEGPAIEARNRLPGFGVLAANDFGFTGREGDAQETGGVRPGRSYNAYSVAMMSKLEKQRAGLTADANGGYAESQIPSKRTGFDDLADRLGGRLKKVLLTAASDIPGLNMIPAVQEQARRDMVERFAAFVAEGGADKYGLRTSPVFGQSELTRHWNAFMEKERADRVARMTMSMAAVVPEAGAAAVPKAGAAAVPEAGAAAIIEPESFARIWAKLRKKGAVLTPSEAKMLDGRVGFTQEVLEEAFALKDRGSKPVVMELPVQHYRLGEKMNPGAYRILTDERNGRLADPFRSRGIPQIIPDKNGSRTWYSVPYDAAERILTSPKDLARDNLFGLDYLRIRESPVFIDAYNKNLGDGEFVRGAAEMGRIFSPSVYSIATREIDLPGVGVVRPVIRSSTHYNRLGEDKPFTALEYTPPNGGPLLVPPQKGGGGVTSTFILESHPSMVESGVNDFKNIPIKTFMPGYEKLSKPVWTGVMLEPSVPLLKGVDLGKALNL